MLSPNELRHLQKQHKANKELVQLLPADLTTPTACLGYEIQQTAEVFYAQITDNLLRRMQKVFSAIVDKGLSAHGLKDDEIEQAISDLSSCTIVLTGYSNSVN